MADKERAVVKRQRRSKRDEVEEARSRSSVRRLSRRSRGMPPELSEAKEISEDELSFDGMVKTIKSCLTRNKCPIRLNRDDLDLERLQLKPNGITQVAKGAISDVKFLPTVVKRVIVVGDNLGYFGLWNLEDQETGGIYLYPAHRSKLSGIAIDPFSMLKIFTSSYDQRIKLLDVEKEVFDEVYQDTYAVYSLCHRMEDVNCLYFGDEVGHLKLFDVRASKPSSSWGLHGDTINTIHCKPNDLHVIATSSADKTVSLWDLRNLRRDKPKSLTTISHGGPIYSAYFSPFGSFLATTSSDNTLGLFGGENYEEKFLIPHNHLSGQYISTLRGIWGWDDSHVYIGKIQEKQKKIDDDTDTHGLHVISTIEKKVVLTLHMPTVPYRLAAHPYIVGTLAAATGKGKLCVWAQA